MDKKKEYKEKAIALALTNGFDQISYYGEWNGYFAYTASRKEDEGCCIGYPQFILVKDGVAHLAPYTQSEDIMGMTSTKGNSEALL